MSLNSLDTPVTPNHLYRLARAKLLTLPAFNYALHLTGTIPNDQAWQYFFDKMLLLLGSTLVLAGIIFFFAYNWAEMHHFTKFGVLQLGILSMAFFTVWKGLECLSGQVALLAAAVLLGALLAVYGQIYQTGADAFGLFLVWAILISPWVLLGTFAPLWLLLLLLLNLSLILYWQQIMTPNNFASHPVLYLLLFILNGIALVAWEYAFIRKVVWLRGCWLARLLFTTTLTVLIIPTLQVILEFSSSGLSVIAMILYIIVTVSALWYYRYQRTDLLLLVVSLLGILMVVTTLIGKILPLEAGMTWLLLALIIIGQAVLAAKWLLFIIQTTSKETS